MIQNNMNLYEMEGQQRQNTAVLSSQARSPHVTTATRSTTREAYQGYLNLPNAMPNTYVPYGISYNVNEQQSAWASTQSQSPQSTRTAARGTGGGARSGGSRSGASQEAKPYACIHPECGARFRDSWNLNAHQFEVHINVRAYQCEACIEDMRGHPETRKVRFNRERDLIRHQKSSLCVLSDRKSQEAPASSWDTLY